MGLLGPWRRRQSRSAIPWARALGRARSVLGRTRHPRPVSALGALGLPVLSRLGARAWGPPVARMRSAIDISRPTQPPSLRGQPRPQSPAGPHQRTRFQRFFPGQAQGQTRHRQRSASWGAGIAAFRSRSRSSLCWENARNATTVGACLKRANSCASTVGAHAGPGGGAADGATRSTARGISGLAELACAGRIAGSAGLRRTTPASRTGLRPYPSHRRGRFLPRASRSRGPPPSSRGPPRLQRVGAQAFAGTSMPCALSSRPFGSRRHLPPRGFRAGRLRACRWGWTPLHDAVRAGDWNRVLGHVSRSYRA